MDWGTIILIIGVVIPIITFLFGYILGHRHGRRDIDVIDRDIKQMEDDFKNHD